MASPANRMSDQALSASSRVEAASKRLRASLAFSRRARLCRMAGESGMSKPSKDENGNQPELRPDAWERFKRAVHKVASSPPKPHSKTKPNEAGPKNRNKKV